MNDRTIDHFAVLADDLSGAHASAARLQDRGAPASVIWDSAKIPARGAVVADIRTRDWTDEVETTVAKWAKALVAAGRDRLELRVDSTLRGSPAVSLRGLITGTGWDTPVVVAVPAYPSAGRTTRDGIQLVDEPLGQPEELDVAKTLFPDVESGLVGASSMSEGSRAVEGIIRGFVADGVRSVVIDATSETDLATAAHAVDAIHTDLGPVVSISSGGWLRYYPVLSPGPRIVLYGSPTVVNRLQLDYLRHHVPGVVVSTPSEASDLDPELLTSDVIVVETISNPQGEPDLAGIAADAVHGLLQKLGPKKASSSSVVVSGGRTAAHLVDRLEGSALEPLGEVAPLCPRGVLRGGPWDGLTIVTKGGRIGNEETLFSLLDSITHK